eukprot:Em0002g617a
MATPMYGPFGLGLEYMYWTYKTLLREVLVDMDTTIQWCKPNGLLARSEEFGDAQTMLQKGEIYLWFSQSHLTLEQILEATFLWTEDMSGEDGAEMGLPISLNASNRLCKGVALLVFQVPPNDGTLPPDFNLGPVLRSFPKLTGSGPSGLRIQHLLDAVEVPLQTPILHSLKAVVNILSSGRAPALISPFLAGGNLTALVKSKDSCASDIRPIAVGETLRRLTAKCLCAVVKAKAAEFFQPHQFGVSCSMGAEKSTRWYLDDGVVAGPSLAVQKVFSPTDVNLFREFCSNYISNKCASAKLLLHKLEEVGAQDAQVALVLLRLCGSFLDSFAQRPPIQKALSAKIDDFQFNQLFNSSSLADRARLLSIFISP